MAARGYLTGLFHTLGRCGQRGSLPIQIRGDCLFNNRYKRGPLKIALRAPAPRRGSVHARRRRRVGTGWGARRAPDRGGMHANGRFCLCGGCLTCRGGPVSVLFHLLGVSPGAGCLGGGLGGVGTRVNHFGARLIICAEKGPKTALFGVDLGGFWDVTRRVWARSTRHKCEKSF